MVGIQSGQQLSLVAEVARAAPERDTRLVPRAGQDGVFALGAIDSEEVQRFVVGVVQTHGHHDVAGADVGKAAERLLNPELLQFHFAAFLGLLFPFAAFLVFFLVGDACATVFELNLCAHSPATAEVVTQVDDSVRYVELTV